MPHCTDQTLNEPAFCRHLSRGATALRHGAFELALKADSLPGDPFAENVLQIIFQRPDGSRVQVEGFFDGGRTYRARAYCNLEGTWTWKSISPVQGLGDQSGSFVVKPSGLKGKVRRHPGDGRQFAYANGDWFLHVGDTGYRYVNPTEPNWKAYIDQAARMGATKIRTWFNSGRHDVEGLFAPDREGLALEYWQVIDQRVLYALDQHPDLSLQLIPFGEDEEELKRYGLGDDASRTAIRYFQARFSALPNVQFCISNDLSMDIHATDVRKIATDIAAREAWGTLLTNHQRRFTGYHFTEEPWSDIITLETWKEACGEAVAHYRDISSTPVVIDEDGYETYRAPEHPRYWFRRFFWSNLFSGGHATYGGLRTWEAYDGDIKGIYGYYDALEKGTLRHGADDFVHIHRFFRASGLNLVGMRPDDGRVGACPAQSKCIHDGKHFLVYLANPLGEDVMSWDEGSTIPDVEISLPETGFSALWYDPSEGRWIQGEAVPGGKCRLIAPGPGDWVLWLQTQDSMG